MYVTLCKFFLLLLLIGSGSLRAKFDLSEGPSKPTTLAVQFLSEGSTLSGVDVELVGTGYRLSLVKKRFATGKLGDFELCHVYGKHLCSKDMEVFSLTFGIRCQVETHLGKNVHGHYN